MGCSEGLSEGVEWSPVVGVKDPPGFDLNMQPLICLGSAGRSI